MLKRILCILSFYDTEPTEIYQGIIWTIIFPGIYLAEHGNNTWIAVLSVLIGLSSIRAACQCDLLFRKNMALAVFIMSLLALFMFVNSGMLPKSPSHWMWILVSMNALFNLIAITNHYIKNGDL